MTAKTAELSEALQLNQNGQPRTLEAKTVFPFSAFHTDTLL